MGKYLKILFLLITVYSSTASAQDCDTCNSTVTIYVDLSSNPDSTWLSPEIGRLGYCCSATGSMNCIRFYVTVHPDADQLAFTLASPPIPPGMEYQVDCGPLQSVNIPMCISGPGPYCIVYCKPGSDISSYKIITSKTVEASPDIIVNQACIGQIWSFGLEESSIIWNTVYPGAYGAYNSYLSCQNGCDTTLVTPQAGYPPYIDVEVSGNLLTPCNLNFTKDTVRVYFVNDKSVIINPSDLVICYGGIPPAALTANPTGGAPPYTYLWNTGDTTQSITITTAGSYWVAVGDRTQCPNVYDTVVVTEQTLPITAHAGLDQSICANNPNVSLNGSVDIATGGIWSGGSGTFTPNDSTLNATYIPTASEISSGSLTLVLTTTGNFGCPSDIDDLTINFTLAPTVSAGPNITVCTNNLSASLSGSVTLATGGQWSGGTGTFSPNSSTLNAVYTPSSNEITIGSASLTLTTTGNGNCLPVSDQMTINIIPEPIVDAGSNQTVCANNSLVSLNGSYSLAGGAIWYSSGSGSFSPGNTSLNATYTPSAVDISNGAVILGLTTIGNGVCLPKTDFALIIILPAPVVNAGPDLTLCSNNSIGTLAGTVTGPTTNGIWSTTGSGTFSPSDTSLNASYISSPADTLAGNISISLTSTNNGSCFPVSDILIVNYTPSPTLVAVPDITVCANNAAVPLNASYTVSTGVQWSSSGTGIFSPGNTQVNPVYYPSSGDTSSGFVSISVTTTGNGNCLPVQDQVNVIITPAPYVFAGFDTVLCTNTTGINLNGLVNGGTYDGTWSTSGNGTFSPSANTLNSFYTPGSNDLLNGTTTLVLTSANNGNCLPERDTMLLTFVPAPVASAGSDQTVCANNAITALPGAIQNVSGFYWETTGDGSFSPDSLSPTVIYYPGIQDTTNGTVTILLNAFNGCASITDSLIITITPAPYIYAGPDQVLCATVDQVQLSGSVSGGSATGTWSSSGSGQFYPSSQYLQTNYFPSSGDTAIGLITLTLTSTNNGNCLPVTDIATIEFINSPTVTIMGDTSICAGLSASLSAVITGGSGTGIWTTPNGTGLFLPSHTAANVTYVPSVTDIANGNIIIIFTTFDNNCLPASDVVVLTITPPPIVDAGPNQIVCKNNPLVTLAATVINSAAAGFWTVNGSGVFNPGTGFTNTTYMPSQEDLNAGMLVFTFTATNGCDFVSDNMNVVFSPAPVVEAGVDQIICTGVMSVSLTGNISGGATSGLWTSSGSGIFSPSSTTLNATYNLSASDTANGHFTLILTSANNGNCLPVSDSMHILITPVPTINAGNDQVVCANNPVLLNGLVTGGSGTGIWTSSGSGNFIPGPTSLNAAYYFSAADTSTGNITLTLTTTDACVSLFDAIQVTITPSPFADAGNDLYVCNTNPAIQLNGTVSSWAAPVVWTTSGSGSFVPDNTSLSVTYNPGVSDIAAGTVQIILSTTNNANCSPARDTITAMIIQNPDVNAGTDIQVCMNQSITLNGFISGGAGTVIWSTSDGTGNFILPETSLISAYQPSPADLISGQVTFILLSTNNGNCPGDQDNLIVNFQLLPVVDAGLDDTLCANNGISVLNGSVLNAGGIQWITSGDGQFIPSASVLNPQYNPGPADQVSGSVNLYCISVMNGSCPPDIDTVRRLFTPAPVVNAGEDKYICSGIMSVNLSGIISGPTQTGFWSTNGTGSFFPDSSALNGIYLLSPSDTIAGSIRLILTSADNGLCLQETDTMFIYIADPPVVYAGADFSICRNNPNILLNGSFLSGTSGILWVPVNGSGIFSPGNDLLSTTYLPSIADLINPYIDFILITTQTCQQKRDTVCVFFTPAPVVNAGADQHLCVNVPFIDLNGTVTGGASQGIWSTSGNGTFGNSGNLSTTYNIGYGDPALGSVNIVLTSVNNGNCLPESDTLTVFFGEKPQAGFTFTNPVCIQTTTSFIDASLVNNDSIISWEWYFESGNTASGPQAEYEFSIPGTSGITLVITSSLGCKDSVTQSIQVLIGPFVDFSSSPNCLMDSVYFTNLSSAAISWQWNFGNGQTSSLQNPPAQLYDSITVFTVSLTLTDQNGCISSKEEQISIHPTPVSYFIVGNFCINDQVTFIDQSSVENDTLISWSWNFGDGFSSTLQNPTHIYTSGDSISISLTISTSHCSDTYVQIAAPYPHPTFTAFPAEGCSPLVIHFTTDIMQGNIYEWHFGEGNISTDANPTHVFYNNGSADTSFSVKLIITTAFGCVDSATNPVIIHPSPDAQFIFYPSASCSPALVSTLNNSTGAASYNWIFNDSVIILNQLNPTYIFINTTTGTQYYPIQLTAISTNGCKDSIIKYVTVNANPVYSITSPDDSLCHPGLAVFICSPEAMSYYWNFGDNSYVSGGSEVQHVYVNYGNNDTNYTLSLIATSFNGCIDTAYYQITIHPSPTVLFSVNPPFECSPLHATLTNLSSGATDFYWDFGDGETDTTLSVALNHTYYNTTPGQITYGISLTAVNANGCSSTATHSVNLYPVVIANFSSDSTGCSPYHVIFENESQYASMYYWNFGDTSFSTNQNPSHTFINNQTDDIDFPVYLVAESPFGCKDTSDIHTITVHPQPHGLISLNNTSGCSDFHLAITNNSIGATSYNWNFGDGNTDTISTGIVAHIYSNESGNISSHTLILILSNFFGCTDTIIESITVFPEVNASFISDTAGCSPLNIQFTNLSAGNAGNEWLFGDGNTSTGTNPSHIYYNTGFADSVFLARLITTSSYSCKDTFSLLVTVHPKPNAGIIISDNSGCSPYNMSISDNTQGATWYYWNFGDGNTDTTSQAISSYTYQHTDTVPHSFTVTLITENNFHCKDTLSQTITIYPQVHVEFNPVNSTGCSPLTVQFENLSENVMTYNWTFGDGAVSGLESSTHTYINNGYNDLTFPVQLISESNFGCRDTFAGSVQVYATPQANFSATPSFQYYPNTTVTLNNLTSGNIWTYHWDFGDGNISNNLQPGTHNYSTWGEYLIILTVSSIHCTDTVIHSIRIAATTPVASYDSSFAGCAPLKVTFINKSSGATWYEWDFGDGGSSNDTTPTYTYMVPGVYTVQLTAGNIAGQDISREHTVTVYEKPTAFFRVSPPVLELPDDYLHCHNLSDNGSSYIWFFGDGASSAEFEPNHLYTKEGNFNITLIVRSENGCLDTMTEEKAVQVISSCELIFPNAFTPNPLAANGGFYIPEIAETSNDIFHPVFKNIVEYHLEIFNRWGELIFASDDIKIGWDGYYRGTLAQPDVYIWKVTAKCANGKIINQIGGVTLIR